MLKHYYINENPQNSWENEVHIEGCSHAPKLSNQDYLWYFNNCQDAIKKAKDKWYSNIDWCYWCINECHTR